MKIGIANCAFLVQFRAKFFFLLLLFATTFFGFARATSHKSTEKAKCFAKFAQKAKLSTHLSAKANANMKLKSPSKKFQDLISTARSG